MESQRYSLEEIAEIYAKNNMQFLEIAYKNVNIKNKTKCLKCENIWEISLMHILSGQSCPNCSRGKNERFTGEILKNIFPNIEINFKIFYIEIFDENQNKIRNKFIVDYYFEWDNKKYIIEYNGLQHYKPVDFSGNSPKKAELIFENQQIRDEFVRNYCKENDINLLEIDGRKIKGKEKIEKTLKDYFLT